MAPNVEILFADGTSQRFPLSREQVTLGSSPRAGIHVADGALEAEHLLFAPVAEGCWVGVARGARTPVYVDGQVFAEGTVDWGSSLSVGPITIKVHREEKKAQKPSAVSLPVLLLVLVGLPAALWMMASAPDGVSLPQRRAAAPKLFAGDSSCPKDGEPAVLAHSLAQDAAARAERYPFDPNDGIEAVYLYGDAAACFRAAGNVDMAEKIERARATVQKTAEEDYKTHRVRLKRALENRRFDDALVEARALLHFAERHEEYREYLVVLVRRLEMQGQKKK